MAIKLMAFDMDGTLLDKNNDITENTLKALNLAEEKGINLALITGRVYISPKKYKEVSNLNCSVASTNGGCIFDENGNKIYNAPLDKNQLNLSIDLLRETGMYFHLYPIDGLITPYKDNPSATNRNRMPKGFDDLLKVRIMDFDEMKNLDEEIYKIIIIDNDNEKRLQFRKKLDEHGIYNSSSWINNIEITSKYATKEIAIKKLAEHYGVDLKDVAAFGDNENDIPMLNAVGHGFLMGNSPDSIRQMTNAKIIGNHDEEGVYNQLKEILGC